MSRAQSVCFEGFVPCRDEGCDREGLHPAHEEDRHDGKLFDCPRCSNPLIKMPKRQARCSVCDWRGSSVINDNQEETKTNA